MGPFRGLVSSEIRRESRADLKAGARMVEDLDTGQAEIIEQCEALMADKAYDNRDFLRQLWEGRTIRGVSCL